MESSPKPHWITLMPLPRYALGEVVKAPMSTKTGSAGVSKVAETSVVAVGDEINGLKWLERGERIWDRLWSYVTPLPFSRPGVGEPLNEPIYRTWECPNVPDEKPAGYDAVERKVYSLLAANQYQTGIPVRNNEDIRQVGTAHIYQVLNLFLQMRYINTLLGPIVPNPGRLNNVPLTFITPSNPNGLTPVQAAATYGMFYPCWTTVVNQNLTGGDTKRASGFADRILLREPKAVVGMPRDVAGQTNVAFSELKNFWVYPTTSLEKLLNGSPVVINQDDGSALPQQEGGRGPSKATINLLHQLWGQSHFLGSQIGFVSNLHGVMILLKDNSPRRSSFVLSSILLWTDPRLLTCLIGLSFIAIDTDHWRRADPAISLLDMLAPGGQADPILQHLPERRFVLPQRFLNAPLGERVAEDILMAARRAAAAGPPVAYVPIPAYVPAPNILDNVNEENNDDDDNEGGNDEEEEEEEEEEEYD